MGIFDGFVDSLTTKLTNRIMDAANRPIAEARAYREGSQPEMLKVKPGQYNDNTSVNLSGLIVDRSVSQMFGKGIELDFEGEGENPQTKWVEDCLDANHQELLFHDAAVAASDAGTGYFLIMPDGIYGKDGKVYPRILLRDSSFMTIETAPDDCEIILRYVYKYKFTDDKGREAAKKIVYEKVADSGGWIIAEYISQGQDSRWQEVGPPVEWPFPFAPLSHWKNLPRPFCPYGRPDLTTDILRLQDQINFQISNTQKLLRYFAHPFRWGKGTPPSDANGQPIETGPDKMPWVKDPEGSYNQLDVQSDIVGALAYLKELRTMLFDITRTVDIDSLQDKIGTLTNFGLKVIYQDNVSKISTKRELFGDMLEELVEHLQIIMGWTPIDCDVVWPEIIPTNPAEQTTEDQALLGMGIVSKETIATNHGLDWEQEQERIQNEKTSAGNIGDALLQAFNKGQ